MSLGADFDFFADIRPQACHCVYYNELWLIHRNNLVKIMCVVIYHIYVQWEILKTRSTFHCSIDISVNCELFENEISVVFNCSLIKYGFKFWSHFHGTFKWIYVIHTKHKKKLWWHYQYHLAICDFFFNFIIQLFHLFRYSPI